ncbi:MAG: hypothetical protein ABIQ53_11255 [Terracoccus sp.]
MGASFVVGVGLVVRTLVGRTVIVGVEFEFGRTASELVQPDRATPASAAATTVRQLIPLIVPVGG